MISGELFEDAIVSIVDRLFEMQGNMTNAQFAEKIGLKRSTLQSIYKNRNQPTQQTIDAICAKLLTTETQLKYDSTELHTLTKEQLKLLSDWAMLPEKKQELYSELIALG